MWHREYGKWKWKRKGAQWDGDDIKRELVSRMLDRNWKLIGCLQVDGTLQARVWLVSHRLRFIVDCSDTKEIVWSRLVLWPVRGRARSARVL